MSSPGQAALEYAARGWQVFPLHSIEAGRCTCGKPDCQSPGKHPRTEHGLKDACADPQQVAAWWESWPVANVGIRTGPESGLFVLDVDSRQAADTLKETDRLIPTGALIQETGRGWQVVFRHPGFKVKNSTGEVAADIDVRGDGGYIVAPPSTHVSGKRYAWKSEGEPGEAPEWLLDHLKNGRRKAEPLRSVPLDRAPRPDRNRAYVSAALLDEYQRVRSTPEGTRNATLNAAAFSLGTLARAGADEAECEGALVSAALVAGLTEEEARRTFLSGWRAGLENPREIPERGLPTAPTVIADRLGAGQGPEDFALVDLAEEVQAGPRFRIAPELASVATERPEWILEGYLARGAITELGAKIKAGKTTFTAAAVSAILAGSPFVGRRTTRCPVLYLTEERAPSFRAALCRVGIQDSPDLHILLRQESGGGSWAEVGDAAIAHAQKVGAGLLVVDTLSDWASITGDQENSAGAALEAVRPLQKAAAAGLAVLVDRHERKSGGEIGDSARGSSAFGGAVDILLSLRRMTSPGHENRRELVAVGRFDDIPPKVVIELEAGEYRLLGDGDELERQEARRRVLDLLPALPEDARTFDVLLEECGEGITRTTLHRALAELLEHGHVRREKGAGTAGARGYGWWLAEVTL